MATSSGDIVAFDLSSTVTTTAATTNGFFDSPEQLQVNGCDAGAGDSLIYCDSNNNDLSKVAVGCNGSSITNCGDAREAAEDRSLNVTPMMQSIKEHHASGDQSIDSGVAGGDSDEADCGAGIAPVAMPSPPPFAQVPSAPSQPLAISRPSSSSGCSVIGSGSGDDSRDRTSPEPLNRLECLLQDHQFMNGLDNAPLNDTEDTEESLLHRDEEHSNSALGGSLEGESSLQNGGKGFAQDCKICQNSLQSPRVLSCLHVFCESCLDGQLAVSNEMGIIRCPVCQQKTSVGLSGASSLHMDYVLTNILDLSSIDISALACTSCKGKDVAISRCNDCANILCASCDNAHQYMRCFENHTVVRLQELLKNNSETVAIHKPVFCLVHAAENLRFFCQHCQVPVCNECLIGDHKGGEHCYELLGEAELTARMELERMQRESKAKVEHCNEAQLELDAVLMELQSQNDAARASIEESYQSFKAVLEKCRDNALKQLDTLHSERELKVMEVMHDVEKCTEKIECAGRFTERVLGACNKFELLSLKALIARQFGHLMKHIPQTNVSYSIEFESNFERFQQLAQDTFGRFQTEVSPISPKESTPPPTLPGMPPVLMNQQMSNHHKMNGNAGQQPHNLHLQVNLSQMNNSRGQNSSLMGISGFNGTITSQTGGALSNSVTASSPMSMPPSMQSSFDGDMSSAMSSSANTQPPSSASTTGSMPSFNAMLDVHHGGPSVGGSLTSVPPPAPTNVPVIPPMNVPPPSLVGGGLTSIAEYNIQQLANLVEQSTVSSVIPNGADMTDGILATNVSVPPPTGAGQGGAITLNDILSIDPHALQAWSKLGGLNQQASALLSRGPSPSVDSLLLNDFSSIAPNADDLMLTNFNAASVTGGGSQNGGGSVAGGMTQQQQALGVGVPGRSKSTAMQIRCKFGSLGPSKGQFNSPHGFCLGVDEEIVVADTNNHRIEVFEKSGTFKFQFGVPGKDEGQLWYPRKVAVMRPSSKFVVCDRGNERSRMQIFNKAGHFMKKIAIRYIDIVAGLAVTNQGHIVAVDSVSPTVFIISEEGDLVHWFDCSDYMREPSDIAINGNDFYVCDFKGHCVAVFSDDGTFKYRIGNEKITCFPNGIDISDAGDILIGDSHGNRFHVACFSRDGVLQSEYECPYVKVSRCCGLKITSEGFVVTLAKNNHHVLVLNTLYIQ